MTAEGMRHEFQPENQADQYSASAQCVVCGEKRSWYLHSVYTRRF